VAYSTRRMLEAGDSNNSRGEKALGIGKCNRICWIPLRLRVKLQPKTSPAALL
jgi:hypothetical protein